MDWLCINISPSSGNNILRFSGCHRSVVECWQPRWLFTFVFMISEIYGTGNNTGNPVNLLSPNPYPVCVLTDLNFWCHVFHVIQNSFVCL